MQSKQVYIHCVLSLPLCGKPLDGSRSTKRQRDWLDQKCRVTFKTSPNFILHSTSFMHISGRVSILRPRKFRSTLGLMIDPFPDSTHKPSATPRNSIATLDRFTEMYVVAKIAQLAVRCELEALGVFLTYSTTFGKGFDLEYATSRIVVPAV